MLREENHLLCEERRGEALFLPKKKKRRGALGEKTRAPPTSAGERREGKKGGV